MKNNPKIFLKFLKVFLLDLKFLI